MKPSHILSWILQLGTAAVLVMAGWPKLAAHPQTVHLFQSLNFDPGGRLTIGLLEILAAILILIPRAAIWGAVLAWGIMSGALIAHLTRLGFTGDGGSMGFLALAVWLGSTLVIILRRRESPALRRMFAIAPTTENQNEPDHGP